jgi:FixJ family two-component response regulator
MASGYLDPHLRAEMVRAGAADFIQKPYVVDSLLEKIQQVLDTP